MISLPAATQAARQAASAVYASAGASPIFEPGNARLLLASLAALHAGFHLVSRLAFPGTSPAQLRAKSWILTVFGAAGMTLASLPYLYDIATLGFDFRVIRPRTESVALPVAWFFIAYLVSDLGLGSIYYRSQVNMVTGWVHHTLYTVLFLYVIHNRWSYLAAVAGILELPTLIMGLGSLAPRLRSNIGFAAAFFATRIAFHMAILAVFSTDRVRQAPMVHGSLAPLICWTLPFPMHVWWGYKTVCSLHRRHRKTRQTQSTAAAAAVPLVPPTEPSPAKAAPPATLAPPHTVPPTLRSPPRISSAAARAWSRVRRVRVPAGVLAALRAQAHEAVARSGSLAGTSPAGTAGGAMGGSKAKRAAGNPFTAPVAPASVDTSAAPGTVGTVGLPFLAIRSAAETAGPARRLLADTARKAWHRRAPETWRREVEREMTARALQDAHPHDQANELARHPTTPQYTSAHSAVARRVAIRLARRMVIGPTDSSTATRLDPTLTNFIDWHHPALDQALARPDSPRVPGAWARTGAAAAPAAKPAATVGAA